ncbi:A disintegrin and metalloproteinase with thrombospondin motifs 1-like [Amphiura filiformis]|uniref:A disintegrin and metalloproteinase with thrombospondin motifs 1-like n=1 Tax=Amphiura filiformis TaxID=82378 RepID=UPI003B21E127
MVYQLQVQCVLSFVVCCLSYRLNFDFMTTDDMERYFNVKTVAEVPEYEIVSPISFSGHSRRKRDLEWEDDIKDIKLQAFGEEYHMRLVENKKLLAKGLEIDIHNENGTIDKIPLKSRRCFYHGKLLSHNISTIAVSTCKGLMGIIGLENHNLYIRPLNERHSDEYRRRRRDVENPHIIYRRSVDNQDPLEPDSHFCGLDPEYAGSNIYVEAMQHRMAHMIDNLQEISDNDVDMSNNTNRRKRATGPKYLEVRVLADRDMAEYYGDDVVPYVVTLMNVVAARYAEPSLGTEVIIHIVKLGVLNTDVVTENGATLTVSTDGRNTLESWSAFQYYTNKFNDNHIDHYDNAMLITRKDLQSSGSNSLLGIAWLSGTCYPQLQAGLSQDAGLSTGGILAHEMGHTLGMPHDGSNGCADKVNVMSSSRPSGSGAFMWSPCSASYFNAFLDSPYKQCLDDFPISIADYPTNAQDRPGSRIKYTADEQCRRLWEGFRGACEADTEEVCSNLYCERDSDGACYSVVPAAEGTYCGQGKWCVSGQCVSNNGQGPQSVDGGWSSWGGFSTCSRTCGGGVSSRKRLCNNPPPQNGGALCEGNDAEHNLCNRDDCATSQPDFAHDQCAITNSEPWNGNYHTWTAYFIGLSGDGLCAFRCLADANFVVSRGTKFTDGTRCSFDGKNDLLKCVNGQCIEFGCDGSAESTQRYDKCRICGGDGSSCTHYSGSYSGGAQSTFTTFVEIPVGATSVDITNTNNRYSFMGVKVSNTNYYIIGENDRGQSNEYSYQGTFLKYTSGSNSESLYIDGPTTVPLSVQVYLLYNPESSSIYRPQISYEHYEPDFNQPPSVPEYYWVKSEGSCSVTCGTGFIQETIDCFSRTANTAVSDRLCDQATRPSVTQPPLTCALPPCGGSGQWTRIPGPCSATCGKGVTTENIICSTESGQVSDSQCDPSTRPTPNQTSSEDSNTYIFFYSAGVTTENIICSTESGQVSDSQCDPSTRPTPNQTACHEAQCPPFWLPFSFGSCSATCVQTRDVWCVRSNGENLVRLGDSQCNNTPKPSTTQACSSSTQCDNQGVWVILSSACSTTCGEGIVTSYVSCRPSQTSSEILSDTQCPQPKPPSQTQCNPGLCVEGIWVISDFSQCSASCGGGIRTREVVCQPSASSQQVLLDSQCPGTKPHTREVCNQQICPVGVWVPSDFSQCTVSCGGGTRTRTVTCRDAATQQILPITSCQDIIQPITSEPCNIQECREPQTDYSWFVLNSYGPCSVTCGNGIQRQLVWCVDKSSSLNFFQVIDAYCTGLVKPLGATQSCSLPSCSGSVTGRWFTTQYSECSATCGSGVRVRDIFCHSTTDSTQQLPESACNAATKPAGQQSCNNGICPTISPSSNAPDQGVPCSGLYTQEVSKLDHISSPTGGRFCKESIVAPVGQTIILTFSRCNIRCREGTDQGYIRDGNNEYSFCCYNNSFLSWTSSTNVVQVEHLTTHPGHGYEMTANFRGTPSSGESGCDRLFTLPSGQISSPGYPSSYPNNQLCTLLIIAPPGKQVNLRFDTFNLHSNSQTQEYCDNSYDYVQIFDMNNSNQNVLHCGRYQDPANIRIPPLNNRVMIQFQSNNDGLVNQGFYASYDLVDVE